MSRWVSSELPLQSDYSVKTMTSGTVATRPLLAQGLPLLMFFCSGWSKKTRFRRQMQMGSIVMRIGAEIFA